ncbi:glycosyltransferase family protein [Lysinibacillus sp. G4S2]|uniref:glycosyltransferase family protein n=1 Tax=Lysinibacillus sp. G4S2 TaxID=3055859 RepID=UPI0025A2FA9C|nr:glycosyltransferase family protein [Lysinibacillus sp. G4S2]MDM5246498.1 glycosyltransferase family protein [Lysinibacillus sp. G4S2]
MNVTAIIQARMGSTRLPGKILKEVNGKPLLAYQLERIARSNYIGKVVIATTVAPKDDVVIEFCENYGVDYYRGSEDDVLSRYYEAAEQYGGDTIVRLTSDCPIIDPVIVDETIQYFLNNHFDYVSNTIERTYPRGLDTEIFSKSALERAYKEATLTRDKEHVTAYMYSNPESFSLGYIKNKQDYSQYRWTVDTLEDYELIKLILMSIYPFNKEFSWKDVLSLLAENPEWNDINALIEQKKV